MSYETHLPNLARDLNEMIALYQSATGKSLDLLGAKARAVLRNNIYHCEFSFPCGVVIVVPYDQSAQDRIAAGHAVKH